MSSLKWIGKEAIYREGERERERESQGSSVKASLEYEINAGQFHNISDYPTISQSDSLSAAT